MDKEVIVPINRTLWKALIINKQIPRWTCSCCQTGYLQLKKDTFRINEISTSHFNPEDPEPTDLKYTFSAIFECNNESCHGHFSSCGKGEVIEEYDYEEGGNYFDVYTPEYFFPPLAIFPVSSTCPEAIAQEIKSSFRLFFCDPAASANHIRKSVENILTDKGIKRYQGNSGRRTLISLHNRIKIYEAKNKDIAERLFAIKWLGNAGSHSGELSKDDVLDAYEILETVLDDLYVGHGKSLKKKISLVNKRKGPLKKNG